MNRLHRSIALILIIGAVAIVQSAFSPSGKPCFASGATTYQVSAQALMPDIRIRFARAGEQADLRMQLVDSADIADFTLVDDFSGAGDACRSGTAIRTIRAGADETAPHVTVSLTQENAEPDFRIYVHSARYSHQDAAAFVAAMWQARQGRAVAEIR